MRRRDFLIRCGSAVLVWPFSTSAQQQGRIWRVGVFLITSHCPPSVELVTALAALGWIEHRTIEFDCVSAIDHLDRVPPAAAALVKRRPDVIVSGVLPAIVALKNATKDIPIVATGVGDPVGTKLIDSLARPGGNLTGIVSVMQEVEEKRVELLKLILPKMKRLAVAYRRSGPSEYYEAILRMLSQVDAKLSIQHQAFDWWREDDVPKMIAEIAKSRFDALYFPPNPLLETNPELVAHEAQKHHLPVVGQGVRFAEAGALMTYSPNTAFVMQRTAFLVDKILRGAKPADLPFEEPSRFDLIVNQRTAKALGIRIPRSFLERADRVIE